MDRVLGQCFVPNVMLLASADCEHLYDDPLLAASRPVAQNGRFPLRVRSVAQLNSPEQEVDLDALVRGVYMSQDAGTAITEAGATSSLAQFLQDLVTATTAGSQAQAFETWGHPLACVLAVRSTSPNAIGELTQLYQQSFTDVPARMSPDFLRCVLWIKQAAPGDSPAAAGADDFSAVQSQFGPFCYAADTLESGLHAVAEHAVYPYLHSLLASWQAAGSTARRGTGFGFGKLLKKLVRSGPPKPETNVFAETVRELQPHVAAIPVRSAKASRSGSVHGSHGVVDVDMQLRRLADVAFFLGERRLAGAAYDALRKPLNSEQRWAPLGGVCEMVAVCALLAKEGSDASLKADVHAVVKAGDAKANAKADAKAEAKAEAKKMGGDSVPIARAAGAELAASVSFGVTLSDARQLVDTALYTYTSRIHHPAHALRCALLAAAGLAAAGEQLRAADLLAARLADLEPVPGTGDEAAEAALLMQEIAAAYQGRGWARKTRLWTQLAEQEWQRAAQRVA